MAIFEKLRRTLSHAWNVFTDTNPNVYSSNTSYVSFGGRQDRPRTRTSSERTIISSIYTKMAMDASASEFRHVRLDEEGRYSDLIRSGLQDCLSVEANIDQAARHFRQDIYSTMFDEGVLAIVPVDTTIDPETGGFDIRSLRIGKIIGWDFDKIHVSLYDERDGQRKQVWVSKRFTAVVENPMYNIMNEPNSTLQRLIRKLNLLDVVDEQTSSGKLDIIIQLPYAVKSETRRQQAQQRKADLEYQMSGSKYGIAWVDATEKITQLNRPSENNLLKQVEYLIGMLYTQLGLTAEIMNGTADEKAMLNYTHRTIEPLVTSVVEAMVRAFLTKTARTQRQSIMAFNSMFKYVPLKDFADAADVFIRGEVFTANEFRTFLGYKPSKDPKANDLRNPNMPEPQSTSSGSSQQQLVKN